MSADPFADLIPAEDEKKRQRNADPYADLVPGSTTADVLKSAAVAPAKAVTGFLGVAGDVRNLVAPYRKRLLDALPEWARTADSALQAANPFNVLANRLPTSKQVRAPIESVTGEFYEPQTRLGKIADTAVQTATTMGRNLLTKAGGAVVAGTTAGTEGAGALTNDNAALRFAGGVIGGGVPALANAMRSRPGVVVKDMVGNLSEEQIAQAIALQERARRQGVPLMGTESLDAGHQLASQVRASSSGSRILEPFLARRPGQVGTAVERDILSATGPRASPDANATRAQQAATDVIRSAEGQRTAAAQPYYKAAEYESIPRDALRPVADELQQQVYRQPINSAVDARLGNVYGQMFQQVDTPIPAPRKATVRARGVDPNRDDIVTAVRKLGGINPADQAVGRDLARNMDFGADPAGAVWRTQQFGGASNRSHTTAGHSAEDITRRLYEAGYVDDPSDFNAVLSKLDDQLLGLKTHHSNYYEPPNTDPLASAIERLTQQLQTKNAPRGTQMQTTVEPETNVGRLNTLYKNIRDEAELPAIGATSEQKAASVPLGRVADQLGDMLRRENRNIRRGQDVYQQFTRDRIDPLTSGPVGVVAGRAGFDPAAASPVSRITGTVADSSVARPDTIRQLHRHLYQQDRQAFPGIVQTHLENKLNEAMGNLRSGPNPSAGAKFSQSIVGTPLDAANFDEMMRGVALAHGKSPEAVRLGARKLLETLDRTGRTPGIGSQTQPRQAVERELRKTFTGDAMDLVSTRPFGALMTRLEDWVYRGRNEDLARALTAPDSVQKLVQLAKLKADGLTARYLAAQLLGLDRAASAGGP